MCMPVNTVMRVFGIGNNEVIQLDGLVLDPEVFTFLKLQHTVL